MAIEFCTSSDWQVRAAKSTNVHLLGREVDDPEQILEGSRHADSYIIEPRKNFIA